MPSLKCPQCGLVNFTTAPECKRCHVKLHQPELVPETSPATDELSAKVTIGGSNQEAATADSEPWLPPPPPPLAEHSLLPDDLDTGPQPFTRWVRLFAITLGFSVLIFGIHLYADIDFIDSGTYFSVTDPAMGRPLWILAPLMHFDVVLKAIELLTAICLLFLLAGKYWLFLPLVRVYLVAGLILQVIEIVAGLYLRSSILAISLKQGGTSLLGLAGLPGAIESGSIRCRCINILEGLLAWVLQYFGTSQEDLC